VCNSASGTERKSLRNSAGDSREHSSCDKIASAANKRTEETLSCLQQTAELVQAGRTAEREQERERVQLEGLEL
jgi:hypothetical protein